MGWSANRAEVIAYLDRLKAMRYTTVRHLLHTCIDWSNPATRQGLLDFVDEADARGLRVLFWLDFLVPGKNDYLVPGAPECPATADLPPIGYDDAVQRAKAFVDQTVGMLAVERPSTRAIAGWTIGNGEDPWSDPVVRFVKEMAAYVRTKDAYHLIGAEAYNSEAGVYAGSLLGLTSTDPAVERASWYGAVDYASVAHYDLGDGVGRSPFNTAALLAQLRIQNPSRKPLLIEEYGSVFPDPADTRATMLVRRLQDATGSDEFIHATYQWDANAKWNVPPLSDPQPPTAVRWSLFSYNPNSSAFAIGAAKAFAAVTAQRHKLGPVAEYTFDDHRSGQAHAHNVAHPWGKLTLSSGASFSSGVVGRSLQLNGATGYAVTADASMLNAPTLGISAYVRPVAHKWNNPIACKNDQFCFFIAGDGTLRVWARSNGSGSWGPKGASTMPIPVGVWSRVEVRYDGRNWKYYVNGEAAGLATDSGRIEPSSAPLFIGGSGTGSAPSEFFNGELDELRFFNVPRASVRYDSDQLVGGTLADSSGNGVSGSLIGGIALAEPLLGSRAHGDGASLAFDGASGAVIATSAGRPPQIAVDFFMQAYDTSRTQYVVSQGRDFYGSGWNISLNQGMLRLHVNTNDANDGQEIEVSVPYFDTGWHHVHASYDGFSAKLSVDGGARGEASSPVTAFREIRYRYNEPLTLGRLAFAPYFYFGGHIDEFEVNAVAW